MKNNAEGKIIAFEQICIYNAIIMNYIPTAGGEVIA